VTQQRAELDPRIGAIAQAVWTAKQEENRKHYVPSGYYRAAWTIYMGPAAYMLLRSLPAQDIVVVQYAHPGIQARGRGRVDQWSVMDVPVTEDPNGPLDFWRLADYDGLTLAHGELK
jgi:hypothetical protein